jgi:hypothetical protein
VRCTEAGRWIGLVLLAGCSSTSVPPPAPTPAPATAAGPAAAPAAPASTVPPPAPSAPQAAANGAGTKAPRYLQLPPPPAPRSFDELRLQLARRLVAAHPDTSYTAPAPDRLMAIPVFEIELNADGSVRNIQLLRKPTTGNESVPLAMAAIRRAAPYGNVSKLPKPWKVVETFLFDDALRFKPRTLDQ